MTDTPPRRAPRAAPTLYLRADPGGPLRAYAPDALLRLVEEGELDLHAQVQVTPDSRPVPLRRMIRELVWTAWSAELSAEPAEGRDAPFETAIARAPLAMAISDVTGRLTYVNEAMGQLLGYRPEELVGRPVGSLSTAEARAAELALGAELYAGRRDRFSVEKSFLHANGASIPCLLSVSMIRNQAGHPEQVVATLLDLRERIELERLRREDTEVATVQRVASGVAHDLRNLLSVVSLTAEAVRELAPEVEADVRAMEQAAAVAGHLTAQLQHLARPRPALLHACRIDVQVRILEPMLRKLLPAGVGLELELRECPAAFADQTDVEQILLNLVVNAGQHTPPGGRVRVGVRGAEAGVQLVIEDNGRGMSPEVRIRALEPFFSRRPGGTGLGLAVVQAAAKRSRAGLQLWSAEGHGTRFTLHFCGVDCAPPAEDPTLDAEGAAEPPSEGITTRRAAAPSRRAPEPAG